MLGTLDTGLLWGNLGVSLLVLVIAANVFAVYVGYAVIVDGAQPRVVYPAVVEPAQQFSEVTNIYAFTPDGERLDGVLLYDQDGEPLSVDQLAAFDRDGREVVRDRLPVDEMGRPVRNLYPLQQDVVDGWEGTRLPEVPPRPVLPRLEDERTPEE